jgi:hypothetical protein
VEKKRAIEREKKKGMKRQKHQSNPLTVSLQGEEFEGQKHILISNKKHVKKKKISNKKRGCR